MTRTRFWISQIIWFFALVLSGVAGSEGDGGAIPFILLIAFLMTGFTNRWGSRKTKDQSTVTGYNGHIIARVMATAFIWLIYMGGTVAAVSEMAGWGVLMALVLMIPATAFTGLIWMWERINGINLDQLQSAGQQVEKRKRQSMDSVLNNLSDDDIYQLRQRLVDQTPPQNGVHGLSDDGELVYQDHRM